MAAITHPGHAYLAARGISAATTKRQKYMLLDNDQTFELIGRRAKSIFIPLPDADGKTRPNGAAKFTLRVLDGQEPKFTGAADKHNSIAFPYGPDWQRLLRGTDTLTITEGPIKAAALTEAGIPTLGMNGINGWRAKIHGVSVFNPDLDAIPWAGRRLDIVPDSDYADNQNVRVAVSKLGAEITKRGAQVYRVELPSAADGSKQGLDDYLVANGIAAYRKLPRRLVIDEAISQRTYTLDELLEDAVYIASTDAVAFLSQPHLACKAGHFERLIAASKEQAPGAERKTPVASQWMSDVRRKKVDAVTFAPGAEVICHDPEGRTALNTWRPTDHDAPRDWKTRAKPFADHVKYLVPDDEQRAQFLLWLAHLVQRPGEQAPWHVLMHTDGTQGIGRNWLASIIGRIVRPYSALNLDISVVAGSEHGTVFNGALSSKVFACVDEIKASAFERGSRRMMETLKNTLAAEHRWINPKYGQQRCEFNRLRLLVLSNHIDSMPLDREDRRWMVVHNPDQPKPETYYAAIYALLDDPVFHASVWCYLRSFDLKDLARGHAPMTKAKHELFDATESDNVTALRDAAEDAIDQGCELITTNELKRRAMLPPNEEARSYEIQRAMKIVRAIRYPQHKVMIEGRREAVWILKNHEFWTRASGALVAKQLEKQRQKLRGKV